MANCLLLSQPIINRDITMDVTCVYTPFFSVSARCALYFSYMIQWWILRDDWQEKRAKKVNRGERRSHATSTNVSTWCTTPVHGLSDQIAHSFVENRIMQVAK